MPACLACIGPRGASHGSDVERARGEIVRVEKDGRKQRVSEQCVLCVVVCLDCAGLERNPGGCCAPRRVLRARASVVGVRDAGEAP